MSRSARAAAKERPEPAKQKDDYLFNIGGWAMEMPNEIVANAHAPIIINAYEPAGPWEKAVSAMERKGENPWRSSLSLTERESSPNEEAGIHRYLLVGFAMSDYKSEHLKKHHSQQKQQPVGTHLNPEGVVQSEQLPLMVVVQIQDTELSKVDLWVLLRPKLGLCAPYHIGQKYCFYLPMFRDGTTDFKQRGPAWNSLVMKQAFRPSDAAPSQKQLAYKRARNTSKVVLEPRVSLQNAISSLVECFAKSGQTWHLKELKTILEQADDDLAFVPIAENIAMRKFVCNDEEFEEGDEGDAAVMVKELHALWPDLTEITAPDLATLKAVLVQQNLFLEYRLLRPFLAEACFQIRKLREAGKEAGEDAVDGVAKDALGTVQRIMGTHQSAAPILTASDESLLLPAS